MANRPRTKMTLLDAGRRGPAIFNMFQEHEEEE